LRNAISVAATEPAAFKVGMTAEIENRSCIVPIMAAS
jgi:hypothetical protein